MKKIFWKIIIFFSISLLFGQEKIILPSITAFINTPVAEHKIVIEKDEIETLKVQNLKDLLVATGIQLLDYGAYGMEANPSIRGFTKETVRVVLDGVCINNAQYETFDFSTINIEDIEKIEIIRGGFTESVSDEGAVGGVIYITTKKQQIGHHFSGDTHLKSYFYLYQPVDTVSQNLSYNGQIGNNSFLQVNLKGTAAANKYFFINYRNLRTVRTNSEVLDGNADIKFSQYFGNGDSVTVSNLFYAGNKNTPGSETGSGGNQRDFNNKFSINLINPSVANLFKLENSIVYLKDARFYGEGADSSKHFIDTVRYTGQLSFFDFFNGHLNETIGLSADYVHLDSTNDGNHDKFSGAISQTTKVAFNEYFSLSLPLCVKWNGNNFAFTPKLGFRFAFSDFAVFINGYKLIQFPNMDQLYWQGFGASGNAELKPENGYGAELGFGSKNTFLPFNISFYTTYYENKIKWANTNGLWRPENVASAFYFGIDFDFEKHFFDDFLIIKGNGEYLYNRLLDESNPLTYGNRIMYTPDFNGSLNIIFNFKYASFTAQASYMGKRYLDNNNSVGYLNPYTLINASAEFTKWKHIKPYLRMDNILNLDYESVPDYPMPGISLTLGVRYNN